MTWKSPPRLPKPPSIYTTVERPTENDKKRLNPLFSFLYAQVANKGVRDPSNAPSCGNNSISISLTRTIDYICNINSGKWLIASDSPSKKQMNHSIFKLVSIFMIRKRDSITNIYASNFRFPAPLTSLFVWKSLETAIKASKLLIMNKWLTLRMTQPVIVCHWQTMEKSTASNRKDLTGSDTQTLFTADIQMRISEINNDLE